MGSSDFEYGELFPVNEIAQHLPRLPGGATHATSKIYNWLNLSNQPGRKTLRSELVGRYRYTCQRWLTEFLTSASPAGRQSKTPGQRERRRDQVKRQLQEAGL